MVFPFRPFGAHGKSLKRNADFDRNVKGEKVDKNPSYQIETSHNQRGEVGLFITHGNDQA